MYNQEILQKIISKFGIEKSTQFCEIAALFYDIKYNACKNRDALNEFDYERDWWNEAYNNLNKQIEI